MVMVITAEVLLTALVTKPGPPSSCSCTSLDNVDALYS